MRDQGYNNNERFMIIMCFYSNIKYKVIRKSLVSVCLLNSRLFVTDNNFFFLFLSLSRRDFALVQFHSLPHGRAIRICTIRGRPRSHIQCVS